MAILGGCAAPTPERALEGVGPVTAYARNTLAAENPAGLIRVGEGFERAGDYDGARRLYRQAMAADPQLIDAQIAYARMSAKLGRGDEAVAILVSISRADPNNRDAKAALAHVHIDAARYGAAISILEGLQDLIPNEWVSLGKAAQSNSQPEKAEEAFGRALDMAPNDPAVLEASALSFALSGNFPSAVGLLRRVMDNPTAANDARRSLAKVYALSGQRQAALSLARGVMTPDEVKKLDFFYRLLPRFTPAEQAAALYFNRIPKDAVTRLSGDATN